MSEKNMNSLTVLRLRMQSYKFFMIWRKKKQKNSLLVIKMGINGRIRLILEQFFKTKNKRNTYNIYSKHLSRNERSIISTYQ